MNASCPADVLDEALARIAATGPEYGPTFTNHAPMVAEALLRLGRADAVERWLDGYLPLLDEAPRRLRPVDAAHWREALGDVRRSTDWQLHFAALIRAEGWHQALARWWPRLLPGIAAGATHGVIRTAHAVRALAERDTPERSTELAAALAYWAARYTTLPGTPVTTGTLTSAQALAQLPLHPAGVRPALIRERLGTLRQVPGFAEAVTAARPPEDPAQALTAMAVLFAQVFLTHGRSWPTAFVHAVTAPAAAASVLPHLPPEAGRPTHDALWQLGAALYTLHAPGAVPEPLPDGPAPDLADVADQAVASGDEHAVKLTEACTRLHHLTGNPLVGHAAARALTLLPEKE